MLHVFWGSVVRVIDFTVANFLLASGAIALRFIVISSLFRTYYRNLREKHNINKIS